VPPCLVPRGLAAVQGQTAMLSAQTDLQEQSCLPALSETSQGNEIGYTWYYTVRKIELPLGITAQLCRSLAKGSNKAIAYCAWPILRRRTIDGGRALGKGAPKAPIPFLLCEETGVQTR
jgi:hypothetical protein